MSDKTKISIAAVFLVLAVGLISFRTAANGDKFESLEGEKIYALCINCGDVSQMDAKTYYKQVEALTTMQNAQPRLVCESCKTAGVEKGLKCESCGNIFVPKDKYGNYDDKCPKCGFSKRQQLRNKK
jgi:Zn finger protein HypA/HybF involved in hydrogenase expression